MFATTSKALVAILALRSIHAAPTASGPQDNDEVIGKLITSSSQVKRFQKLLADSSGTKLLGENDLTKALVWDFNSKSDVEAIPGSQGGINSGATPETFPILLNSGLNINFGTIGPCGILLPHIHPRANEFFVVVENELTTGTTFERNLLGTSNPSPEINQKLSKYKGTLFPQGSVHFQYNDSENCKETHFMAVLSADDPGATPILQEYVSSDGTKGRREAGKADFEAVRPVMPPHVATILEKCFTRCNIQ